MSLPIAIAAVSIAAEANNSANKNSKKICELTMNNFNNKSSTVEQKQQYADCVKTLYPPKMSVEHVLALKILFMTALIIFVLSVFYNLFKKSKYEDLENIFWKTLYFNIVIWFCAVIIGLIILGLIWVFN